MFYSFAAFLKKIVVILGRFRGCFKSYRGDFQKRCTVTTSRISFPSRQSPKANGQWHQSPRHFNSGPARSSAVGHSTLFYCPLDDLHNTCPVIFCFNFLQHRWDRAMIQGQMDKLDNLQFKTTKQKPSRFSI